jgi:hypothetical protein
MERSEHYTFLPQAVGLRRIFQEVRVYDGDGVQRLRGEIGLVTS